MPKLIHRRVTTIQIVSVEVTWAEEQVDLPPAGKKAVSAQRWCKPMPEVGNTQDEDPPILGIPQVEDEARPLREIPADDTASSDF